jgi:hypothetical protein
MPIYDEIISGRYFANPSFAANMAESGRAARDHRNALEREQLDTDRAIMLSNLNNTAAMDRQTRAQSENYKLNLELAKIREDGDIKVEKLRQDGMAKEADKMALRIKQDEIKLLQVSVPRNPNETDDAYIERARSERVKAQDALAKAMVQDELKAQELVDEANNIRTDEQRRAMIRIKQAATASALKMAPEAASMLATGRAKTFEEALQFVKPAQQGFVMDAYNKALNELTGSWELSPEVAGKVRSMEVRARDLGASVAARTRVMPGSMADSYMRYRAELTPGVKGDDAFSSFIDRANGATPKPVATQGTDVLGPPLPAANPDAPAAPSAGPWSPPTELRAFTPAQIAPPVQWVPPPPATELLPMPITTIQAPPRPQFPVVPKYSNDSWFVPSR